MPFNVFNDTSFDPSAHVDCPVEEMKVLRVYSPGEYARFFFDECFSFFDKVCDRVSLSRFTSFVFTHEITKSVLLRLRAVFAFALTYWTHLSLALIALYHVCHPYVRQLLTFLFERRSQERRVTRSAAAQEAARGTPSPQHQPRAQSLQRAQSAQADRRARAAARVAQAPARGAEPGRRGAVPNPEYVALTADYQDRYNAEGISVPDYCRSREVRFRFPRKSHGALVSAILRGLERLERTNR